MAVRAIRGATTVKEDSQEAIKLASLELANEIVKANEIDIEEIAVVLVTMTSDLTTLNASGAIRLGLYWDQVPFFTSQEAEIVGMLARCIRISIQYNTDKPQSAMKHVYLHEAAKLRPDLKD